MLFALATARIDFGSGFDSSLRAALILFSVSARAWLLREGMVTCSHGQAEGVFGGGRNRDLVGIAPGYPINSLLPPQRPTHPLLPLRSACCSPFTDLADLTVSRPLQNINYDKGTENSNIQPSDTI